MSATTSPTKQYRSNSLLPLDRPSSAGDVGKLKKGKKGSPQIFSKIGGYIRTKKSKNKEEGEIHVKPRCFVDPPADRQNLSESPEPNARSSSVGSKHPFKVSKKKEETKHGGPMWRVKGRLEWESDSGRQLSISDVKINELSKVEIESLQRQAVISLQAMDIPVSHGLVKGTRGKIQMRSFNTFNRKKVNGSEKQDRPTTGGGETGIFGQPLTSVLSKDPNRPTSGTSTPVTPNSTLPRTLQPPSLSPTSTSSSEVSFFEEANATALLLEALSQNATPSPRSKRRQSLCPADRQVPSIVTKAIEYLDTKGMKMQGLFRISGAKSRINEIRDMFDSGQNVELTDDMNPHDVACLLKEFFRSLPEPLLTRDLYHPFLATRRLSSSAQRRDALRLLCTLLPNANRDTLQELLQFLSRVAMYSNGIILIDGTEETGNLMTEKNLALIIGPNILHKEVKRKGDNLLQKSEQEEMQSVCEVMEDLIRMQSSIFTIPAQLYDTALRLLMASDPNALDQILKRRCLEQGLYLNSESPNGTLVPNSHPSNGFRKVSVNSNSSELTIDSDFNWRRSRSLSDTQKNLDDAIRSLEQEIAEDLNLYQTQSTLDGDSGDSAVGEMSSPVQSTSEPSTLNRKRGMFTSRDSAFSNNTSPTNSSEGMNNSDVLSMESDSPFTPYSHTRMSSGISGLSAMSTESPAPGRDSPEQASSPQLGRKGSLCGTIASSLPSLNGKVYHQRICGKGSLNDEKKTNTLPSPHSIKRHSVKNKRHIPSVSSSGTFDIQRSPILSTKEFKYHSETQLHILSCDHTPTDSSNEIDMSPSRYSLDCDNYHNHTEGTVI